MPHAIHSAPHFHVLHRKQMYENCFDTHKIIELTMIDSKQKKKKNSRDSVVLPHKYLIYLNIIMFHPVFYQYSSEKLNINANVNVNVNVNLNVKEK